jgi:hypothetical protein
MTHPTHNLLIPAGHLLIVYLNHGEDIVLCANSSGVVLIAGAPSHSPFRAQQQGVEMKVEDETMIMGRLEQLNWRTLGSLQDAIENDMGDKAFMFQEACLGGASSGNDRLDAMLQAEPTLCQVLARALIRTENN